jgi:ureidoglycolate lyase
MASITAHDNQSGLDLTNPPSVATLKPSHLVPLALATNESLRGFGHVITDFATAGCAITPWPTSGWRPLVPGTGDEGGCVEDVFRLQRRGHVQYAENVGLGRTYVTGWYGSDPSTAAGLEGVEPGDLTSLLTHEANYHPDGAQVFAARAPNPQPFVLLLAPPGDDVTPADFRAFYVDPAAGTLGVHVNAGVWHQPAFPAAGSAGPLVMDNRQGRVHACVSADFVREFGCYLRVPLVLPPALGPSAARGQEGTK